MFLQVLKKKYIEAKKLAKKKNKKLSFLIGNTTKIEKGNHYFTPPRITDKLVVFGIIVFKESIAIDACRFLDGKVDIFFVDAEKKIFPKKNGSPGNIERRAREVIRRSRIFIYKGNDLTVDAVNLIISQYFNHDLRGASGKKIGVIGAGNIGSKIGLNLTELGAKVYLNRRNTKKLRCIVNAINYIKPLNTQEKVVATDKITASKDSDVLIGTSNGKPIINFKMVNLLKKDSIIIDAGKGTLTKSAIKKANTKNINIFRVDIFPSLEGLISKTFSMERQIKKLLKKKKFRNINIFNSGKLGGYGDMIVDDIDKPSIVYGICDGKGDFLRKIPKKYRSLINKFTN
jgi:hypothetical protein